MMKNHLLLAAGLLLIFASVGFAQPKATPSPSPNPATSKPKPAMSKAQLLKKLSAAEKKLWDAFKNKDPKPFKAGLTVDSFALSENGIEKKEDTLKMIPTAPCEIKSYDLSDWKLTIVNASTTLITYKGKTEGTCAGQPIPTVWCSTLYVNRGGKWLALFHTETPAK